MDALSPSRVVIALATYQGDRFLARQLESLQAQSFVHWRLLVRDDGSTDQTLHILRQFAANDDRIEIITDQQGRLGATANFGAVLEAALARQADYFFLADQDDVWQPDKIQRQLEAMRALEKNSPAEMPLLVHSDLTVVDAELQVLHPSFMTFQGIGHEDRSPLRTLLLQNFVTGCTCLMNRALVELALPVPPHLLVHDWWIAVCAAAAGQISYVPQPTVLYRQHGQNSIGAKSYWASLNLLRYLQRRWRRPRGTAAWSPFTASVDQAAQLAQRLRQRQLPRQAAMLKLIDEYLRWHAAPQGRLGRAWQFRALGVRRQRWIKHWALYYFLLKCPKAI